jgi:hypothetical protein
MSNSDKQTFSFGNRLRQVGTMEWMIGFTWVCLGCRLRDCTRPHRRWAGLTLRRETNGRCGDDFDPVVHHVTAERQVPALAIAVVWPTIVHVHHAIELTPVAAFASVERGRAVLTRIRGCVWF